MYVYTPRASVHKFFSHGCAEQILRSVQALLCLQIFETIFCLWNSWRPLWYIWRHLQQIFYASQICTLFTFVFKVLGLVCTICRNLRFSVLEKKSGLCKTQKIIFYVSRTYQNIDVMCKEELYRIMQHSAFFANRSAHELRKTYRSTLLIEEKPHMSGSGGGEKSDAVCPNLLHPLIPTPVLLPPSLHGSNKGALIGRFSQKGSNGGGLRCKEGLMRTIV